MSEVSEEPVYPSSILCTIEEYFPGENCYVDDETGFVRSSTIGRPVLDLNSRVVRVSPLRRKPYLMPREGNIVVGVVQSVKVDVLLSNIFGIFEGKKIMPTGPFAGILHVSQASSEYVRSLSDIFSVGDVIFAKALNGSNPFHLSTRQSGLGVVLSSCGRCGHILLFKEGRLVCPRCKMSYQRHVSRFYLNLPID